MRHEMVFHGVGDGMAVANGLVAIDLDVNLNDILDPHSPHPQFFDRKHAGHGLSFRPSTSW